MDADPLPEWRFTRPGELFRGLGIVKGAPSCRQNLADLAVGYGQWEKGSHLLFAALESYRRIEARRPFAECLSELSRVAVSTGDLDEAYDLAGQALAIDREINNRQGVVYDLDRL